MAQEKPQNSPDVQTVNTKNPQLLKTLNSQGNNSAIAITPDGKTLLTGGNGKLEIWDLATGKSKFVLELFPKESGYLLNLNTIAIAPNGKYFITGSTGTFYTSNYTSKTRSETRSEYTRDGYTIQVWDMETGKLLHTLSEKSSYQILKFSQDGQSFLAMNQEEGKVWNTQTWEKQRDFKMEFKLTFCPQSIGVSPDLQTITVAMWRRDQILTQNIVDGSLRIYSVHKEGEKIAINSKKIVDGKDYYSGEIKNIKTGELKTLEDELEDELGDGKLGVGSRQKLLEEKRNDLLKMPWFLINIPIANVCTPISYNGKISVKLDVDSDDGSDSIIVSNLSTANFKKFSGNISKRNFIDTQFKPEIMTVSPDYHTIATTNNGKIGLWDVCHGKLINTIDLGLKDGFTINLGSGSYIPAFTFIFTPDGNTLITGDNEGKIKFWQVNDSAKSSDLKPASCPIIQNAL